MAETERRKDEDIDRMLRRFNRSVKQEGIIDDLRSHERYEKKSERQKREKNESALRHRARQRDEDL
jgi:small subunit ribosomal protein S21